YFKADFVARYPAFREFGAFAAEGTYVFRNVDGQWLLAEPLERELGQRGVRQTDHFRIRFFEWDNDLIDGVSQLLERAYADDAAMLGIEATDPIYVTVDPILALNMTLRYGAYAYYREGTLHIRSPESYSFGLYPAGARDETLLRTLKHEYAHHL